MDSAQDGIQEGYETGSFAPTHGEDIYSVISSNVARVQTLTPGQLLDFAQKFIPQERMPDVAFMASLSPSETADALLACALVWTLSNGSEVPREFQLKAGLAAVSGWDTVVRARTGSGKTLAMAIPMLLRPHAMAIVVSPLKRLQSSQVGLDIIPQKFLLHCCRSESFDDMVSRQLKSMRTPRTVKAFGRYLSHLSSWSAY